MKENFFILIFGKSARNKLNKFFLFNFFTIKGEEKLEEKQIQRLIYGNYRNDVGETFSMELHERKLPNWS